MICLNNWQLAFILLLMIFLHIVDDFYLQGCLANLKQKDWWRKQESYCDLYENDYIVALICHAFSWSFMINLPWTVLTKGNSFIVLFSISINFIIYSIVDTLKANKKIINLQTDQLIHIAQIFVTWMILVIIYYSY